MGKSNRHGDNNLVAVWRFSQNYNFMLAQLNVRLAGPFFVLFAISLPLCLFVPRHHDRAIHIFCHYYYYLSALGSITGKFVLFYYSFSAHEKNMQILAIGGVMHHSVSEAWLPSSSTSSRHTIIILVFALHWRWNSWNCESFPFGTHTASSIVFFVVTVSMGYPLPFDSCMW